MYPSSNQFQPTGDWIVVEPFEQAMTSQGGIELPLEYSGNELFGRILAVGPGFHQNGVLVQPLVKPHDVVMYKKGRGISVKASDTDVLFMTERDFLAVVSEQG